jgi:hypothetical protein
MSDAVTLQNEYALQQIQQLEARNVYQDIFFIETDKQIATINNYRLGRLATANVRVPFVCMCVM